jgi:hypothetical protein
VKFTLRTYVRPGCAAPPNRRFTARDYKSGVTRQLAVCIALLALSAGCSGGGEHEWSPEATGAAVGSLVAGFNDHAADVDEPWERSPVLFAGEFLRLDRREAARTSVVADVPGEGTETAEVTVVLEGLLDDSIAAERFVLGLRRQGDVWALASARWAQRCAAGRGHSDFSTEPCI